MHLKCLWKSKQYFDSRWKTEPSFKATIIQAIVLYAQFYNHDYLFFCHRCTCVFYAPTQYLGNTQCSAFSPEFLREEILAAWHYLCTTCPYFFLCTVQKVQRMSSAISCTSNSIDPFLLTSPDSSD